MNLKIDEHASEDLHYWKTQDAKKLTKILLLIEEVQRNPFTGIGKPEPLKYHLSGCWSRRIDRTHRLVCSVQKQKIRILSCRFHY